MTTLKPGQTLLETFLTVNPTTGASADASTLPTAVLRRNGVTDGAVTVTVTNNGTGDYLASAPIPGDYVAGDLVELVISATVSGVAGKIKRGPYGIDTKRASDGLTVATNNDKAGYTLGAFGFTVAATIADKTGFKLAPDGADAIVVETGINLRQAVALILSGIAGLVAKATNVFTFKAGGAASNGPTRIVATTNAGERTSVTLTPPA